MAKQMDFMPLLTLPSSGSHKSAVHRTILLCVALVMAGCAAAVVSPTIPAAAGNEGVVVQDGVEARSTAYDPATMRKQAPWRGEWIAVAGGDGAANAKAPDGGVVSMLRKEVVLDAKPAKVMAWMTGEDTFRLYINGKLASRGPVDNGRDFTKYDSGHWFYEGRDLTSFFHSGRNVIAVELFRVPFVTSSWRTGHAGFLFEAEATVGTNIVTMASDSS